MPQISYIKYKDILEAHRYDAEYFKPEYFHLRKKIKSLKTTNLLSYLDIGKIITGHTPSMANESYYGGKIKFIKTDNLRINYIKENFNHYLSDYGNKILKSTELKENDILVTIIGATEDVVGRVCIVNKEILPANINQNIALIRVDDKKISPYFLNMYLNSKYGRKYLHSLSRQTEQVNLNCREVEQLLIPNYDPLFQLQIEQTVKSAHLKQNQSKQLYKEAENILLEELGLNDYYIENTLTFYTTKREVDEAKRFDSEYFQPKYAEIMKKIRDYKGGYFNLSDKNYVKIYRGSLISDNFYNLERGIPYIRGADFSSGILENEKNIYIDKSFNKMKETVVKKNDIVFSLIGSVGATAVVPLEFDNSFISNNTGKICIKNFDPIVLQIVLQSIIGKLQFEKEKTQTAQPKISIDQVGNFEIPIIRPSIQEQIAEKVQESHRLRKESKKLLEEAKRKVEEEIENI